MTKEELKAWFWNTFYNCYVVRHSNEENSIFLFHDINYIRKKKFNHILGKGDYIYCNEISGKCLFEIDYNFDNIIVDESVYIFIKEKYYNKMKNIDVQILLTSFVNEKDEFFEFDVKRNDYEYFYLLKQYNMMERCNVDIEYLCKSIKM